MPNVVRFALDAARDVYVPGVGSFHAGILDVDANNLAAVKRARYLVTPYRAVEIGIVDSKTPKPNLPVPPGPPAVNADPYPQYLTMDEIVASPALKAASVSAFIDAIEAGEIDVGGGTIVPSKIGIDEDGTPYFIPPDAEPDPTPTLTNTGPPTITGTPVTGQTLTASTGSWSATPDSYTYQWKRGGAAISGATASSYVLVQADVGSTITVTVGAGKANYTSGTATSAPTGTVAAPAPTVTFADDFNRADGPVGNGWTAAPDHGIVSGKLTRPTGYSEDVPTTFTTRDLASANGIISAVLNDADYAGIVFRYTDNQNYWKFGGTKLQRTVGGVTTDVVEDPHNAKNGTLTVTLDGPNISASINGVTYWTATDTFNQTATKHGVVIQYGQSTIDSFTFAAA